MNRSGSVFSISSEDADPLDSAENYYSNDTQTRSKGKPRAQSLVEVKRYFNDPVFGFASSALVDPSAISVDSEDEAHSPTSFPAKPTVSGVPDQFVALDELKDNIVPIYSDSNSRTETPPTDEDLDPIATSAAASTGGIAAAVKDANRVKPDALLIALQNVKLSSQNNLKRRLSIDGTRSRPKKFYITDIDSTLEELLRNEDTDHNHQITIDDLGPKVLKLGTSGSQGYKTVAVSGNYMLANLLQELTLAKGQGRQSVVLDERRLNENPVDRMKRFITTIFWKSLTRQVTPENIMAMTKDTKIKEVYKDKDGNLKKKDETHRIYVPCGLTEQYEYFQTLKKENPELEVEYLPLNIDAKFIKSLNNKPGLLALAYEKDPNDSTKLIHEPYIVPGGRFNEFYDWDSYMITLGLLLNVTPEDQTNLKIAKGMTENFIYSIKYYGKCLNANRSYYLGRSQPPFLTDMALRVFNKFVEVNPDKIEEAVDFLKRAIIAAIKEYKTIWTAKPRLDDETGLSTYHPEGLGVPPETESTHFDTVLNPYALKHGITKKEFIQKYNDGEIKEPGLDLYFVHDRALRESGLDTTYRFEGRCADLATIDLNSLIYKYETDIAFVLETFFQNKLTNPDTGELFESSDVWLEKAAKRKDAVTKYLWNEEDNIFYDWNVRTKEQINYESVTSFWPLWSKLATPEQAEKLVANSLSKFEEYGGLVSGTLRSRGEVSLHRPSRQWDYPYGWSPQQILAWLGLSNYGYSGIARRLAYRWLFLMTKAFVDYNGVVVEKYDVTNKRNPHKVDAEYGNQGTDFKCVATEGFGWANASYLVGLTFLNEHAKRSLGVLTPPDVFLSKLHPSQRVLYE